MELGTIEREIFVDAATGDRLRRGQQPRTRQELVARRRPVRGRRGLGRKLTFGDPDNGGAVESLTVVEVDAPRTFSFRWTHPAGEIAGVGNSLLVTFELLPSGDGTLLRMTETGFREMGWEAAVLEEQYNDHVSGWDYFIPRLATYAAVVGCPAMTPTLDQAVDDELWSAIGDPTRRRMLDLLLSDGVGTATTLGQQLPVTRQAVDQAPGGTGPGGSGAFDTAWPRAALPGGRGPVRPRRRAVVRSRLGLGCPTAAHQADRRDDPTYPTRSITRLTDKEIRHGGHSASGRDQDARRRRRCTTR